MARWLGVLLAIAVAGGPASAQVFKPKTSTAKKSSDDTKKATPAKKSSSTSAKKSTSKKRVTTKSKKNAAADRSRPDDLTPDAAPKESDKDYVKITDDDDIE